MPEVNKIKFGENVDNLLDRMLEKFENDTVELNEALTKVLEEEEEKFPCSPIDTLAYYQSSAHRTAIYDDAINDLIHKAIENPFFVPRLHDLIRLFYATTGLTGEVGEFCNKTKKVLRDNKGVITDDFREMAKMELGGILWYLSETATVLGLSLDEIGRENLAQLASRQERGVLHGSGDER